jgi:geranylgeranyl reductase
MYDIIIVGGGPAGAMAGKYLANGEQKVLLLQKDFSFKKPCGGGIRMDAFDEFNIHKDLIRNQVNEIILETKKRKIEVDISHVPLAIVDRIEFDEALRQDARDVGVEILEAKVSTVKVLEESVRVVAEDITYEAKYLIAADGVLSLVRKQLKAEVVPKSLTHYSDVSSLVTNKCHFYFGPTLTNRAYAWRFPYEGGTDVGTFSSKNGKNFILNLFKFLNIEKNNKIKGYNIPSWDKPLFFENRVFYVGDAAGQVMPFTYEGIYYAMKSAKILASVINEKCDFTEYEKRWNELYFKKFTALKKLQRIFLMNNFMIHMMMKTLEKPKIKEKVLALWMDQYEVKVDKEFFIRSSKRLFN